MAKNGAGVDPDIEDVPPNFGDEEDDAVCDVCGTPIFNNPDIYELTGMCGACTTGEADMIG